MDLRELHDALESACLDVMDGSPPSRLQASRVERAIGDVLRRRGIRARVEVGAGGQTAKVTCLVRGPRGNQVVLELRFGG